jgi:hypothetical protein
MVTEPLWEFWANMLPGRVCASDELHVTVTDHARLPVNVSRKGYRGLDRLQSELRSGRLGVIVRTGYHTSRGCDLSPLCTSDARTICCGPYDKPPGPWRPGPASDHL